MSPRRSSRSRSRRDDSSLRNLLLRRRSADLRLERRSPPSCTVSCRLGRQPLQVSAASLPRRNSRRPCPLDALRSCRASLSASRALAHARIQPMDPSCCIFTSCLCRLFSLPRIPPYSVVSLSCSELLLRTLQRPQSFSRLQPLGPRAGRRGAARLGSASLQSPDLAARHTDNQAVCSQSPRKRPANVFVQKERSEGPPELQPTGEEVRGRRLRHGRKPERGSTLLPSQSPTCKGSHSRTWDPLPSARRRPPNRRDR